MLKWITSVLVLTMGMVTSSHSSPIPPQAKNYQRLLTRTAHAEWGLNAPIALFAGQIHQESLWRPDVSSRFASGLTQFTKSTAKWIGEVYPEKLGEVDVFNPAWAIRAMVMYDRWLYDRVPRSATEYDRWSFTLSAYNGGLSWVGRDAKICAAVEACDPEKWQDNVSRFSARADWAIRENRGYIRILRQHQYLYATWGPTVEPEQCSAYSPT